MELTNILATVQFLLDQNLPPLPVAPKQDADKHPVKKSNSSPTGKSKFTGKNPSYLNEDGNPVIVYHSSFQDKLPSSNQIEKWFKNHRNGVGTLGGKEVIFIDVDVKNFISLDECEFYTEKWLDTYQLRDTWIERTRSNGYRVVLKTTGAPEFTNFMFDSYQKHVGEALGHGRFVVLAPTEGYKTINRTQILEVDRLESIGILSTKSKKATVKATEEKTVSTSRKAIERKHLAVSIRSIKPYISRKVRDLLRGKGLSGDRSRDIVTVIRELYGWKNRLEEQGKYVQEDIIKGMIEDFAELLEIESKLDRIYESVDLDACRPAKEFYGA